MVVENQPGLECLKSLGGDILEQSKVIKLRLSDWTYNAGIVGIVNILKYHDLPYSISGREVSFSLETLSDFNELTLSYLRHKYRNLTMLNAIKERIARVEQQISSDTPNVTKLNEDIEYIKSKFLNSAYKEIISSDLKTKFKKVKQDKKTKELVKIETLTEGINDLKWLLKDNEKNILSKEVVGYYDQKARASKSPFAVVDKYINTGIYELNKSFAETEEYVIGDKDKFKFECFQCGGKISKIDKGLNFLNNTYFDTARKTSHVWNFVSDIEPCPICKLVYMSIPAGITTIHGRGIFINETNKLDTLVRVNNNLYYTISENEDHQQLTYGTVVKQYVKELLSKKRDSLNDVQVVEYKDNRYRFSLLSKSQLEYLCSNEKKLENLIGKYYIEGGNYFTLYDITIKNIINNQNLYTLVDKLLHVSISSKEKFNFNDYILQNIIKLENGKNKGGKALKTVTDKQIDKVVNMGREFRMGFQRKGSEHKVKSIAYRLQGALRAGNSAQFMDSLLSGYSYINEPIPNILIDCLKDENVFKTYGYAFASTLIGTRTSDMKEEK